MLNICVRNSKMFLKIQCDYNESASVHENLMDSIEIFGFHAKHMDSIKIYKIHKQKYKFNGNRADSIKIILIL